MNNLYGKAMMEKLPVNNFKWNNDNHTEEFILNHN